MSSLSDPDDILTAFFLGLSALGLGARFAFSPAGLVVLARGLGAAFLAGGGDGGGEERFSGLESDTMMASEPEPPPEPTSLSNRVSELSSSETHREN